MAGDGRNFDYIIVGGGTAGCVLANRPRANPQVRALLLEAGPEATSMWIGMPLSLRVVDAAVMPIITSGNTVAAAIMVAEKAADFAVEAQRTKAAA